MNDTNSRPPRRRFRRRRQFQTTLLYLRVIIWEFRWTLLLLTLLITVGTLVFVLDPVEDSGKRPPFIRMFYGSWMAMLAQPFFTPGPWYVAMINSIFPVFGLVVVGEGIVRFGMPMFSRRHGEKEWMMVMASTYRDHVILCGLGHLGHRIFEHLISAGVEVVGIEVDENGPFIRDAKATGMPVLIRDMTEDQSLIDAGIQRARTIIIATNKDMANLEVAIDARRMNPKIRVVMRLFDQRIAQKIAGALTVDAAFSSSALAAPIVAAMSLQTSVLSSVMIGGVSHLVSEMKVSPNSAIARRRVDDIERNYAARVLARAPASGGPIESPPALTTTIEAGDTLFLHAPASQLTSLAAAITGAAA